MGYELTLSSGEQRSWFRWISFDYRVTLGFGSIADGLDHVNPVIRLPLERGIGRVLGNHDGSRHQYSHHGTILSIVMRKPGTEHVSQDAVLLCVFLFTLTGSAKTWVDRLTLGAVNTWDLFKKAFIQRYCPPSKTTKQLEDVHNFKQESDESLYHAWEQYNDLLYKCLTHNINKHQKWHDGTSNRNVSNNNNTDGLDGIISKLDNLGRDMKKVKENVHAIQLGCQICEGPHIDKECPLSTRKSNRLRLEELMNKHQEESARRSAQIDEWIKKLHENAEINTRNQSASFKYLETQINKLTKELQSRTTNGAPSLSTRQCKVVNVDHETPNTPNSSSKLNNPHRVFDAQRDQNKEERATKVLQCQLPPKELNLGNFTLLCTIRKFNFYGMADLGASVNVMPRNTFEYLRLANLRKTNMLVEMANMMKKVRLGKPFLATIHAEIDAFDKKFL
ncbi:reverse transcriptase domain-containing protein [Tanacetum coccineum]